MNAQFLAQLRLANFPQRDSDAVPTCAELVAACGQELHRVEWERTTAEWTAYSATGSPYGGQTPEDALANLWLATHRQFTHDSPLLNEILERKRRGVA
jgi:hypothetical protein